MPRGRSTTRTRELGSASCTDSLHSGPQFLHLGLAYVSPWALPTHFPPPPSRRFIHSEVHANYKAEAFPFLT